MPARAPARRDELATLQLARCRCSARIRDPPECANPRRTTAAVLRPGGEFKMGTDLEPLCYYTERRPIGHPGTVLARHGRREHANTSSSSVTRLRYPRWWSDRLGIGRREARTPRFWRRDTNGAWLVGRFGPRHPSSTRTSRLQHVCWYEADAYARWAGRRLPQNRVGVRGGRSDARRASVGVWSRCWATWGVDGVGLRGRTPDSARSPTGSTRSCSTGATTSPARRVVGDHPLAHADDVSQLGLPDPPPDLRRLPTARDARRMHVTPISRPTPCPRAAPPMSATASPRHPRAAAKWFYDEARSELSTRSRGCRSTTDAMRARHPRAPRATSSPPGAADTLMSSARDVGQDPLLLDTALQTVTRRST